jgi:hypothetical protein
VRLHRGPLGSLVAGFYVFAGRRGPLAIRHEPKGEGRSGVTQRSERGRVSDRALKRTNYGWTTLRAWLLSVARLARSTRVASPQKSVDECMVERVALDCWLFNQSLFGARNASSSPRSPLDSPLRSDRSYCLGPAACPFVVSGRASPLLAIRCVLERARPPLAAQAQSRSARPDRSSSIRGAGVMSSTRSASRRYHSSLLSCPRCGLSIRPRVQWLAIEHCPRCLAHAHLAVRLISPSAADGGTSLQRPTLRADHPGSWLGRSRPQ